MNGKCGRVRLMTWNVWGRFGANWRKREDAIVSAIEALEPDVIALQEVWSTSQITQADVLGARLGLDTTFAKSRMPQDEDPEVELGLAVMSRWPLSAVHQHRIGGETIALHAELALPGHQVHFLTTCLDWEEDHDDERMAQAEALGELVGQLRSDDHLVVLAGDLNAPPDRPEIGVLKAVMTDCWSGESDAGHTYSSENPYLGHGEWIEDHRIDYILAAHRDPHRFEVLGAGLTGRADSSDLTPSDHYAVFADLTVE
jgi:endonuclease/exonuclease/phosphatase family metal-dependent hydrolase